MQEKDYTFVTLDSDDAVWTDAVVVDMDESPELLGAVVIDEDVDSSDFITLVDDIDMISDADMSDIDSFDIGIDGTDISFIL